MVDEYAMNPGGALRIRRHDESGTPEEVKVRAEVARRAKFLRLQFMEAGEGESFADREMVCAVFRDERTGEVYGQPVPDQEGV
jgi:hypothetical protein